MRVAREFYSKDTRIVARELLGKILVRKYNYGYMKARIVETEAYIGPIDKACHAYGDKKTKRTITLYEEPGVAYVYLIYGMYYCLNLITEKFDYPAGVLIRAVEPLEDIEEMSMFRYKLSYDNLSKYQKKNFTNGPSKLCMAMNITKKENGIQTLQSEEIFIEEPSEKYKLSTINIIESKRIGIDYAEEAKDFLWRYYIEGNFYVSKL